MKDFKDFMGTDLVEEIDEEELSDRMWEFIVSLDDAVLDNLSEEQIEDYVEIIEAVAGEEDEELDEFDKTIAAKSVLRKYQFKDAFTLPDHAAKPLLKQKFIVANKGRGTYSITDKGKNFLESADLDEKMPAKRVRRDIIQKKKASREHRKVKAKRKIEGRRKRKTAKFKRFKKKSKRMAKRGLTSRGTRKRTFINKG